MTGISCCLTSNSFSSIEIYFSHVWSISVESPSLGYLASPISHSKIQPFSTHPCYPESQQFTKRETDKHIKGKKKNTQSSQSSLSYQGTLRCCKVWKKKIPTTTSWVSLSDSSRSGNQSFSVLIIHGKVCVSLMSRPQFECSCPRFTLTLWITAVTLWNCPAAPCPLLQL